MKMIKIITAMDCLDGIGFKDKIPWKCPEDLKFFKETTEGHTVVMGRKTAESLKNPLKNRRNVVLSRGNWSKPGFEVMSIPSTNEKDVSKFIEFLDTPDNDIFVIGGAEIYKLFLPVAEEIIFTLIKGIHKCDTYFPDFDVDEWKMVDFKRLSDDASVTWLRRA